jgi:hypothetical protein
MLRDVIFLVMVLLAGFLLMPIAWKVAFKLGQLMESIWSTFIPSISKEILEKEEVPKEEIIIDPPEAKPSKSK